jgi:hypothetical protein
MNPNSSLELLIVEDIAHLRPRWYYDHHHTFCVPDRLSYGHSTEDVLIRCFATEKRRRTAVRRALA